MSPGKGLSRTTFDKRRPVRVLSSTGFGHLDRRNTMALPFLSVRCEPY